MDVLSKGAASVADAWREAWAEPDYRPIYEWAAGGNIYLPPCYTITGEFSVARSRHFIDVFDCLHNDQVYMVTLIAPPRSGKSMTADIWIPSVIARDPGPVMWNLQTDKIATDYAVDRVHPILKNSRATAPLWPTNRYHANTLDILFQNGAHLYIQGPSIGNLQTKGIKAQVNDECYLWKPGRLLDAHKRCEDYRRLGTAKILNISQGGDEGDTLHVCFKTGDVREWMVPCTHCGKFMFLTKWHPQRANGTAWGVRWDEPQRSKLDRRPLSQFMGQILTTVRFECEHCGQVMLDTDRTKSEWNRLGKYQATNPDPLPGYVSHRYSGLICRAWKEMVAEFILAKEAFAAGITEPLKNWIQKNLPDFWSTNVLFSADPLRAEAFDVRTKWEDEFVRIMTVDVQEGYYWYAVHAWSKDGDTRRLDWGQSWSETEIEAKQKEWSVEPFRVLLDSKWDSRRVYGMCARHGWIALRGEDDAFFLHALKDADGKTTGYVRKSTAQPTKGDPEGGYSGQGARYAHLIRWSNPIIKERVWRSLEGRGNKFVVPSGGEAEREDEYRKQLRAEYPVNKRNPITGKVKREFVCPSGNNHMFDCACMQFVAATLLQILPDDLESDLAKVRAGERDAAAAGGGEEGQARMGTDGHGP